MWEATPPSPPPGSPDDFGDAGWQKFEKDEYNRVFPPMPGDNSLFSSKGTLRFQYSKRRVSIPVRGETPSKWEKTDGSKYSPDGTDYTLYKRTFPSFVFETWLIITVKVL